MFSQSFFILVVFAIIADVTFANTCTSSNGVCHGVNTDEKASTLANRKQSFSYKTEGGNICLENIKNMRDISSAFAPIREGTLYRTDCVSNSTASDVDFVGSKLGIKTWIDLRSPDEWEKDENFHNGLVYEGFTTYQYDTKTKSFIPTKKETKQTSTEDAKKRRYLVSFISEIDVIKIVFFKLSFATKIQTLLLAPFSFIPPIKRFMRKPFMEIVNSGGLSYLNELILMVAGEKIVAVLRLFISEEHFPLAYYCTAGKDRAGLVSMLLLYLLDVPMDHIVADYEVSRHVYEQLDDHAVIASLQRLDMDPKIFLGAPPVTVYDTFQYIEKTHGSVEAYLAKYGFTDEMKQQLKRNFLGK